MRKIFIVGCPRSGTTLVQEMLAAHGDVYTLRETHYFRKIRRRGRLRLLDYLFLSPRRVRAAYAFIADANDLLVGHDPSAVHTLRAAARFFDRLMTAEAQARGRSVWVEKTPLHLFDIRLIRRLIPAARFVHVIRDGRDVVASLVDAALRYPQTWGKFRDVEAAIELYNRSLAESLKYLTAPGHHFVSYERLLESPEAVGRRLYTALGLTVPSTQPALDAVHRRLVRPDEGWKEAHRGAVVDTRRVKFRRLFDAAQQRLVAGRVLSPPPELEERWL